MAKRRRIRLNRKLVLVTLALVLTGSVGIVVAHRAQFAATVERARGIGISATANEDWHEAVSHLRLYLQHHPQDLEAKSACAHALAEGYNELAEAVHLYEQVLKVDHYQHDVRRQLVKIALKLERTETAVKNAEILADRFPGDAEVLYLAGKSAEADQRIIDAIKQYRAASRYDEDHVGANQRLAVLYKVVFGNDQASAKAIERLEKSGDRSFETLATIAEHKLTQGSVDEASQQLIQAVEAWDNRVEQLITASRIAIRIAAYENGQHDSKLAKDLQHRLSGALEAAIKDYPESVFLDMSLAQLQAYAGMREQSVETLQKAINRVPENLDLDFQLTWQLLENRQFDSAKVYIDRIRNSKLRTPASNQDYADLLVAVSTLQKGEIAEAAHLLHEAGQSSIESSAVASVIGRLEASCYEQLADWENATEAWLRVLQLEPGNRLVRLSMAFSLAASGEYDDSIRVLKSIPRLGKVLASSGRRSGDTSDSLSRNRLRPQFNLSRLISKDDSELSPRVRSLFTAILHVAHKEYQQAQRVLDSQDDVQERLIDIVALISSTDVVDSSVLETIVTLDRSDPRPVTTMLLACSTDANRLQTLAGERLAGLAKKEWVEAAGVLVSGVAGAARSLRESDLTRADQLDQFAGMILNRMVEYDRNSIPQMVEYHLSAGRFDKAIQWCRAGWPDAPERLALLWLAAAQQHSSAPQNLAELESVLVKKLNQQRDAPAQKTDASQTASSVEVEVGMALADLYLMTGRDSQAEPAYARILKLQPDHVHALNNLAWLKFVNQREVTFAMRLIEHAIEIAGERPDLLDTRGCIKIALGNSHAAAEDFTKAIRMGAGPDTKFHLAIALHRGGDYKDARKKLAEARDDGFSLASVTSHERQLALEMDY